MWGQSDAVLALHFGFALLCFTCVLLLTFLIFHTSRNKMGSETSRPVSRGFRYLVWGTAVYTYLVVYTGAYVRHAGASMACSDWPLCNGKLIPSLSGIVGVQFGHRVAAAITLFLIAYITFIAVRRYKERRDIYWGSVVSLVLIVLQVISGALTIWFNLNLVTSLVHTTLISVLFGMLCYLALQVRQTAGAKDLHEKNQVPVKKVLV